jgi:uncharacterized protein YjaZ
MGTTLHILNSGGQLDCIHNRIEASFTSSLSVIEQLIPVRNVDVVVYRDAQRVIPEIGLCGISPSSDRVFVAVDPLHPKVTEAFEIEFMSMLGHELHHCARWAGPGYGSSLMEALVSEGLACSFESELRCGEVPFYAKALSPSQLEHAKSEALSLSGSGSYNHASWFFGTGKLPRHAGYSLGFHLVSRYIAAFGNPASKLTQTPAVAFYE